jgi:uncharacterized membrane protein
MSFFDSLTVVFILFIIIMISRLSTRITKMESNFKEIKYLQKPLNNLIEQPLKEEAVILQAASAPELQFKPDLSRQDVLETHNSAWLKTLESKIASQWGLWLGGFVLFLSVGFFIREAIVNGWVGPYIRTISIFALAGGFLWAGQSKWLHRIGADSTRNLSQLRPVLNAVGVSFIYAGLFAAGPFYGLIGNLTFSAGMFATSIFALFTSLRYGTFVGIIGLLGGFVLPWFSGYKTNNIDGFLLYLFMLFVAADISGHAAKRTWLSIAATCLAVIDGSIVGIASPHAALFLAALSLYTGLVLTRFTDDCEPESTHQHPGMYFQVGLPACALLFGAISYLQSPYWIGCFAILATLGIFFSRIQSRLFYLSVIVLALDLVFICFWPESAIYGFFLSTPYQARHLYLLSFVLIGMFTLPIRHLNRTSKTDQWLIIQAICTFCVVQICYIRTADTDVTHIHSHSLWNVIFVFLAIGYMIISIPMFDYLFKNRTIVARHAQGIVSFLFGLLAILHSVGPGELANTTLIFIAIVLLKSDPRVGFYKYLRPAIYVVTSICFISDLSNLTGVFVGFGPQNNLWTVIHYGVYPALFGGLIARSIRHNTMAKIGNNWEDADIYALTALSFVALSIIATNSVMYWRNCFGGNSEIWIPFLLAMSFAGISLLLWRKTYDNNSAFYLTESRKISRWVYLATTTLFVAFLMFFAATLITETKISGASFFVLLCQYLVPAALALWAERKFHNRISSAYAENVKRAVMILAAYAGFMWVSTEVFEIFGGKNDQLIITQPEIWGLSLAWMLYGAALIAAGLYKKEAIMRYSGISMIGLTSLKVLLIDTSALSGMDRVFILFGFGIVLIGVGLMYQKYANLIFQPEDGR